MAHTKIRLKPAKQRLAENGRMIKGTPLRLAVSIKHRFDSTIQRYIDRMIKDTEREIQRLFESEEWAGSYGMDANIGSQAKFTLNSLNEKFGKLFIRISGPTVDTMINQTDRNSASTLKLSLFNVSEHISLKTDIMTPVLKEIIAAQSAEAVSLIKRVPAEYLDSITTGVMQAITTGHGLQDIVPLLEKQKVKVKNWARNVAHDQTRKVYAGLNKERMRAIGIRKYEWIHSHGVQHPNLFHLNVLDGQIFSFDDPPIIDPKTGTRGGPGEWFFCSCTARPIVDFSGEK